MASTRNSLFDVKLELNDALREKLRPYIKVRNFLVFFAIVFFLIAWNRGVSLIYVMSALMLGVLLVSFVAPYLSLRGASITREQYLMAAVGETLEVTLSFERVGGGWCRMLEVYDRVPCAEDGAQTPSVYIPKLHKSLSTTYQVEMTWRGIHTLGPLELRSSYPLGVHRVSREVENSCATVLVYPTPFFIARMEFDRAAARMTTGAWLSSRQGGYDEFSQLREYRHGDSVRHIHWAKSSQGRELQVKQYETYEKNIVSIVLDRSAAANIGEGRFSTFEFQVSIALSIARYCMDRGIQVALYNSCDEVLAPQCSEPHYRHILESLALVQADDEDGQPSTYVDYAQTLIDDTPQGCWVLFGNDDNAALQSLNYHRFISQITLIQFNSRSFSYPLDSTHKKPSSLTGEYYISRNDDLEKVFS